MAVTIRAAVADDVPAITEADAARAPSAGPHLTVS
jgi:hypothetical protein